VYEVADRQSNVDLINGRQLSAGKDGNSRALYAAYGRQFMPRIGFAWTPPFGNNRLAVQAGYGITSYMEGTGANLRLPLNPPFFFESEIQYDLNRAGDIRAGFTDVVRAPTLSGQVRAWNPQLRPAFIQQAGPLRRASDLPPHPRRAWHCGHGGPSHLADAPQHRRWQPTDGAHDAGRYP